MSLAWLLGDQQVAAQAAIMGDNTLDVQFDQMVSQISCQAGQRIVSVWQMRQLLDQTSEFNNQS